MLGHGDSHLTDTRSMKRLTSRSSRNDAGCEWKHLEAGPGPPSEIAMANKFMLRGYQIEVEYTIGGNPSLPALIFKRGSLSKSFAPSEVHTDSTALGLLVSVPLVKTVDTGGETFAFFLRDTDVPQGQTAHFTTTAILERFGGPDSVPRRLPSWEAHIL